MKTTIAFVLTVLLICPSVLSQSLTSPKRFTGEYLAALKKALPEAEITRKADLELTVKNPSGKTHSVFLENAYKNYKAQPAQKASVIRRFVAAAVENITEIERGLDVTRIVPIIRDKAWWEGVQKSLIERGIKDLPEQMIEDYNSELIIIYAEDTGRKLKYFTREEFHKLHIDDKEVRSLAVQNLNALLPEMSLKGSEGLYLMTTGGDYEASLLLFDSIWKGGRFKVKGDIVVAIPRPDVLIITGSREAQALEKTRILVDKAFAQGADHLTKSLFVYRNGRFVKFEK